MGIQQKYCIIFSFLAVMQIICAIQTRKSEKPIGKYTSWLNLTLVIPIAANVIIITSSNKVLSYIGYYASYIGMTLVVLSLILFTNVYCKGVDEDRSHKQPYFIYVLATIDIVQLLLGPLFHHVIKLEKIKLEDNVFYLDVPGAGLTIHRIIDYFILVCVFLIYTVAIIKTSRLYREKYTVILAALLLAGITQLIFIITRYPVDRSVIAHGVSGILIFYFSIIYRPLRLLDTMLSHVVSDMNDTVYVFDNSNKLVWANDNAYKLLDLPHGTRFSKVQKQLFEQFSNITNRGDNWSENRIIGDRYYILEKKSVKSDNLNLDGCFLVIKDDTKRHQEVEKEIFNSKHDSLTGLYNMQYLYSRIHNLLLSSEKDYYILFINIKNFKLINDTFGKHFGDIILIRMSKWLKENIKNGLYGRLIGDTFGVCIPKEDFSEELLQDFDNFIVTFRDLEHKISIHIGIYDVKDKSRDVSIMFDRANLAITDIEENYKTIIRYYNEELKNNILEEQRLSANFGDAVNSGQIFPYLQPIADKNGKVVGVEALARWDHPEFGFLPPDRFISLFEKNGMITDLDRHIWKCACEVLSGWKDTHPDLFISVNISPKDFYFIDVIGEIKSLVAEYDLDPAKLRIEITETAMMSDSEQRIKIFNQLRTAGFLVEMDDFGSGYSSLNLLKDLPVDVLKLDMKFLSDDTNLKSGIIIKNIINLANELNIISLTEGVETREQFDLLVSMNCSLFQGYYFAKPMPVDSFEEFLNNHEKASAE
ncbi:diguanylate cyclase (GGDEF) domain-containing protein [Eubacterium ruminantium]|nr:diguanylate cyclase (GGDEF) domain-containing protein [Eubacterium ruminantium]